MASQGDMKDRVPGQDTTGSSPPVDGSTLQRLIAQTGALLIEVDVEGRILRYEQGGGDGQGAGLNLSLGRNIFEVLADQPELATHWRTALGGTPFHGMVLSQAGHTFHAAFEPVRDGAGAVTGAMVLATDQGASTARQRQQEEMGRIAAAVAHEVRNPINSILVQLELLRGPGSSKRNPIDYYERIERQALKLEALMRDMLALRDPIQPRDLTESSLRELVEQVATRWREAHPDRAEDLQVELPEGPPLVVYVDEERITQAVHNLLDNAAAHSRARTPIRLRLEKRGGHALLHVLDRGCGVPEVDLEAMFDPFYSKRRGGSGLGLQIVRAIMHAHGGSVEGRNRPEDQGTDGPAGLALMLRLPLVDRTAPTAPTPVPDAMP